MPDERAGDDDDLVLDAAGERAVDEKIGIEVALPVVPELRRVGVEPRHRDARALERLRRLAIVVARRPVDELEHVARNAEVGQDDADRALHRRERAQAVEDRRGYESEHLRVDAHRHLRRVARFGEDVEHLADPVRLRVGQVEALAVESLLVREIVERVGDEVHRHDVDAPALDADHRHPSRKEVSRLLQRLEEVVRPVDLVDLAGLRVADDEPRPVDAERPLAFVAHDAFRVVLGLEVRVIELFGLVEHVLAERPFVESGRGDRAHVMEAAGGDGLGEAHRVARPLDVRDLLRLRACRDVVDRGEVEEVVDLPLELFRLRGGDPEPGLLEVAVDGDHLLVVGAPARARCGELLLGALADEHVNRFAALQEVFDEVAADEAGRAGHEISHLEPPCGGGRRACLLREVPCERTGRVRDAIDGDCNSRDGGAAARLSVEQSRAGADCD